MGEDLGKKLIRLQKILSSTQSRKRRAETPEEKQKYQDEISSLHSKISHLKQQILKS